MAARLRAVSPDERAAVPKSVTEAAASGDRRGMLSAMRDRVATAVENANTPARDLAALTKRLIEIDNEIAAFDARHSEEVGAGAEVSDGKFDPKAV